jgi:hypothetical protein
MPGGSLFYGIVQNLLRQQADELLKHLPEVELRRQLSLSSNRLTVAFPHSGLTL